MKKNMYLFGALLAVIVVFVVGMLVYQNKQTQARVDSASQNASALLRPQAPSMGAADAKVTLVEFFDPACEACRAYAPVVKAILADNPGKVRLVLRYAAFHNGSEEVAKILEAAKIQGLFWQALDAAYQSQPVWAEHGNPQVQRLWDYLKPLGLDIVRAQRDIGDPGIASVLAQDKADVVKLQIQKTPTMFVNGKQWEVISPDGLRLLVEDAIQANYP